MVLCNIVSLCFEFSLKNIFVQKNSMVWFCARVTGMSGRQMAKTETVGLYWGVSKQAREVLADLCGGSHDWVSLLLITSIQVDEN
jgi:hypothetical protein